MTRIHDLLALCLRNLEGRNALEREETLANAVMETGGIFAPTPMGGFQIELHGVRAFGRTQATAAVRWSDRAQSALAAQRPA
ncbi:hypothetical protein KM176_06345 [Pseudooceanicola sp. CBS1P-1]|uniref:Uncharacterized protein n=1 Tax=Pseudooceanicola albus TaxID=2692189 RepID=A0A6L7FYJ6_9RHOB|nr:MULTISPECIES: hypothetical protein [Pseudooceanicola]MBT9383471.1 hypothetical protein [Pseudooceanicola endophyticus]MXN16207.1 hypothetical protein [Pseudooceanicola albus]